MASLREMIRTKGEPKIENKIMKSGVILRHLVLPGQRKESIKLLERLKQNFGTDKFILSLMSQYFPPQDLSDFPEINRKITSFEYDSVVSAAADMGFENCYTQAKDSADKCYVPDFDL